MGRVTGVTSSWVDANHPATLASNITYAPTGAMTGADYGNGTLSRRTYNSGGQLKTLKHGIAANQGSLMNLEYNYQEGTANNGRITGIVNYNDRTRDQSFTYDGYYRLATAQTAGTHWGLSWSYDRYGNRLSQNVTKGSAPSQSLSVSTSTNRVNSWSYDLAGNVTNDTRNTYTFDATNQITQINSGATQYRYDGTGTRKAKITGAVTTYYTFGLAEWSPTSGWTKLFVYLGSEKLGFNWAKRMKNDGKNSTFFDSREPPEGPLKEAWMRTQSAGAHGMVVTDPYGTILPQAVIKGGLN